MLTIDILTPFPNIVDVVTKSSILSKANKKSPLDLANKLAELIKNDDKNI